MKRILLLAALLLSSAAQAETWVCSSVNIEVEGSLTYLRSFVRQDIGFSTALTTPMRPDKNPITFDSELINILSETDEILTLVQTDTTYGTDVSIYMINKNTKKYVVEGASSLGDTGRAEGVCVSV